MIGNITTGKNFNQLINYLLKDGQDATIVVNPTLSQHPREIAKRFRQIAKLRPSTKKPCKHIIIGFAPSDGEVSKTTIADIARDAVEQLNYTNNQYLVVQHGRDSQHHDHAHHHDHIHIVVNMIGYDGERTNDFKDKSRLERILRELELKYRLTKVKPSRERSARRPRTKAYQKFQKEYQKWQKMLESNPNAKPPQEPEIQTLQAIIKAAVADRPTLSTYLGRLQFLGYKMTLYKAEKGRKRLKYHLKSQPGKTVNNIVGGSLNQLLKAGVSYQPQRDDPNVELMNQGKAIALAKTKLLTKKAIEQHRYQWLRPEQQETIKKFYERHSSKSTLQIVQNSIE